jgi:signal transduction histidine kinase
VLHSLRARLLFLFAVLALGPLITVGILDYLRSRRMVERLIVAQTDAITRRAAGIIADRYSVVASDILLFSENADVQELFAEIRAGNPDSIHKAHAKADAYLRDAWRATAGNYRSAEVIDSDGELLWRASGDSGFDASADRTVVIREPIHSLETKAIVGTLVLVPERATLWAGDPLGTPFGRTGYGVIIDRRANRILLHPNPSLQFRSPRELFGPDWSIDSIRFGERAGSIAYTERDSLRLASFVSLSSPPWTIISSTAVREFSDTFDNARRADVVWLAILIATVAAGFLVFISRATRSLERLTRAAVAVGRGELSPELPPASRDEVGTLATAFGDMTSRIREMMREIEVSRQLAVVGEFAAQLAHEVRNPLTSLKLDLQGLDRQLDSGALPATARPSVESSLREVSRLDAVVSSVLRLARQPAVRQKPLCLHEVIDQALATLATQFADQRILVERRLATPQPQMTGDAALLSGMLINLLLNASEAQPAGGRLGILSSMRRDSGGGQWVDVTIADDGPGIGSARREAIFRPFYTTRHGGTGLGLALALRTAREHGGHLTCVDAPAGFSGAAFVISLPVVES